MTKNWNAPKLNTFGSVEEITLQTKFGGSDDGTLFDPDGPNGPISGVPIGPQFDPNFQLPTS
ncbi:hypothetical protein [Rivularia sp. UHCC 0363]|uniref:hypothetical protein n=1 Tax=Rivularia sp. UHCC 0363 TaxID=3110244 RepID=UPI002B1EA76D|nr:hypothetical protein [Rivularia sp. UHCC 0363]MEA5598345.1 hypothetical protein [Rivularia sp. UHCC 0363]